MNATLERLRDALNAHDPEAIAALFAPDYRSEQPVHPNRGSAVTRRWPPTGGRCSAAFPT